jgi:hypothetical protein
MAARLTPCLMAMASGRSAAIHQGMPQLANAIRIGAAKSRPGM